MPVLLCAHTCFLTKGFKIYGQGFPVLTSVYITFLWEFYFVVYTINILNSILLHNTCILLMFVGYGTDQPRGQLKSEEFYCSLQDCKLSWVIFRLQYCKLSRAIFVFKIVNCQELFFVSWKKKLNFLKPRYLYLPPSSFQWYYHPIVGTHGADVCFCVYMVLQ